jgi:MFS family permease
MGGSDMRRVTPAADAQGARPLVRLGLRANAAQFALLMLVNGFVGATLGAERSVLPLLARDAFGIASATSTLGFLVTFGLAKATANYAAGRLAGRVGRRRLLVVGWTLALPVGPLIYWAPAWSWVVVANALLGVHQGLAWSATVLMKIDLAGPRRRGLAMGLNEFAGYAAIAAAALAGGYLAAAFGPRPALLSLTLGAAVAGLVLTLLFIRDTALHVRLEASLFPLHGSPKAVSVPHSGSPAVTLRRLRRQLVASYQAGLVNNLNDGLAWGLLPLYFAAGGLTVREIGWLAGLYPGVWAVAQIGTGALSDRIGRRGLIASGMVLQGAALALMALRQGLTPWAFGAILLGLGTAAVYPTLIAQVSDLVGATDRARAIGAYRWWRDMGYVVGAILSGFLADRLGIPAAILVVAVLTAASGLFAGAMLGATPTAPSEAGFTARSASAPPG